MLLKPYGGVIQPGKFYPGAFASHPYGANGPRFRPSHSGFEMRQGLGSYSRSPSEFDLRPTEQLARHFYMT